MSESSEPPPHSESTQRRGFLQNASALIMSSGLVAGYGALAAIAGRFLYPSAGVSENWQFVTTVNQLKLGQSLAFQTPAGAKIVIARQQAGETADSFVALSSICPHLGCKVHWESQNDRFFCPCHNGAFDSSGTATEGPPAAANQSLTKFPLKVERGLLFIAVSSDTLTRSQGA